MRRALLHNFPPQKRRSSTRRTETPSSNYATLLLRKGELIYGGLREHALRYFEQLGYSLVLAFPPDAYFVREPHSSAAGRKRCKIGLCVDPSLFW